MTVIMCESLSLWLDGLERVVGVASSVLLFVPQLLPKRVDDHEHVAVEHSADGFVNCEAQQKTEDGDGNKDPKHVLGWSDLPMVSLEDF